MNLDSWIGDKETFSLEHRILNTVFLAGIVICIITSVTNYLFHVKLMALVSVICGFILGALYYLSLRRRLYRLCLTIGVLLIFVVTPFLWKSDGGMLGATPFYILIYAAMIAVSVKGTRETIALIGGLTLMTSALILLEYFYPAFVADYASKASLFIDNSVGLLIALVVITSLYVVILSYYRQAHARAAEYQEKLKRQEIALEMARFDRLNLVGQMAAGIGHEVRNPLTTIRGFLQYFQHKKEFDQYRDTFDTMIQELDRANSIISEFLSLAKDKNVILGPLDINDVIERLFPLIKAGALQEGKEVFTRLEDIPPVNADENEIRQLLLNLTRNAVDAMKPGGIVTIATCRWQDEIILDVSDTGPGIPADIYAKLGTPFVTGKENGTGLGIPICFRIAERHGAKIEIDTSPAGTTFRIKFPLRT